MTERDENEAAADVMRHVLKTHETPLPADVEAAWAAWSAEELRVFLGGFLLGIGLMIFGGTLFVAFFFHLIP